MIAGSMRMLSDIQGLTFSRCCCIASTSPRYRSSSLVRRFSSLRNLCTSPIPAAVQQWRTLPSCCLRQPGTPVTGHSCQPCCGFSSGGPQPRRLTAYAPRPHWRAAAAAPRPSWPARPPSRHPLPARHASRPGHGSAAAPRPPPPARPPSRHPLPGRHAARPGHGSAAAPRPPAPARPPSRQPLPARHAARPGHCSAAAPRLPLPTRPPSRHPLPARHAARPGHGSAAAPHRPPRSRSLVRSGTATGAQLRGGFNASFQPNIAGPVAPYG